MKKVSATEHLLAGYKNRLGSYAGSNAPGIFKNLGGPVTGSIAQGLVNAGIGYGSGKLVNWLSGKRTALPGTLAAAGLLSGPALNSIALLSNYRAGRPMNYDLGQEKESSARSLFKKQAQGFLDNLSKSFATYLTSFKVPNRQIQVEGAGTNALAQAALELETKNPNIWKYLAGKPVEEARAGLSSVYNAMHKSDKALADRLAADAWNKNRGSTADIIGLIENHADHLQRKNVINEAGYVAAESGDWQRAVREYKKNLNIRIQRERAQAAQAGRAPAAPPVRVPAPPSRPATATPVRMPAPPVRTNAAPVRVAVPYSNQFRKSNSYSPMVKRSFLGMSSQQQAIPLDQVKAMIYSDPTLSPSDRVKMLQAAQYASPLGTAVTPAMLISAAANAGVGYIMGRVVARLASGFMGGLSPVAQGAISGGGALFGALNSFGVR